MNEQLIELMSRFKTIQHDDLSLEMKQYAQEHDVPIIQDQGLELMLQLLRVKQPKTILEIGSAIGYSSLMMARHLPQSHVVTIERDESRYKEAVNYHARSTISDRVTLIKADALGTSPKKSYISFSLGENDIFFFNLFSAIVIPLYNTYDSNII